MNKIKIINILKLSYPQAKCSLHFKNPWELLVATILSAQCADRRVNLVTENLFKKYLTISDYADSNLLNLEKDIKSTGFYRNKAKNIQNSAKKIMQQFSEKVPNQMNQLLELPGVARKTANVGRVSQRLGLTKNKDPKKIEQDLLGIIDRSNWIWFSHAVIEHGRSVCQAKKPKCLECPFKDVCPSKQVFYPE